MSETHPLRPEPPLPLGGETPEELCPQCGQRQGDAEASERLYDQLQFYARDLKTALREEKRIAAELEAAYYDTVARLMAATRFRDSETGDHLERISGYVEVMGRALGMPTDEVQRLSLAASLHDIGKIAVENEILYKDSALDDDEFLVMQCHTTIGGRILHGSPSPLLQLAETIALTHHEHWDGSGYPLGLRGEAIPLPGRIAMLADTYDALRSKRPYKDPLDHQTSLRVILEGDHRSRPSHFDPQLLEILRQEHLQFDQVWRQAQPEDE
jgi:putative two-component system response regulator